MGVLKNKHDYLTLRICILHKYMYRGYLKNLGDREIHPLKFEFALTIILKLHVLTNNCATLLTVKQPILTRNSRTTVARENSRFENTTGTIEQQVKYSQVRTSPSLAFVYFGCKYFTAFIIHKLVFILHFAQYFLQNKWNIAKFWAAKIC